MKRLTALLCLVALAAATDASAQQFDVAGQLALLNRNTSELSGWDNWYSAAAFDATAGRYWTPHFKTELEIGTASEGRVSGQEQWRYREHRLRESTIGATAFYQFFDNQWVHPFVGGGVELARERHIAAATPAQTVRFLPTDPGLSLPPLDAIDTVSYAARPVLSAGVKFYVAPRAFIRTEVRTSFDADRPVAVQWRGGAGFDIGPARPTAEATDTWRTLAAGLEPGVAIDVRLRDGQRFKATFIESRGDALVVQRKTREPVSVESIGYERIASLSRTQPAGMSAGKATGIALGSAGAAIGAVFLILLATLD